jgi:ribose-phosphate pyrophosphokinase
MGAKEIYLVVTHCENTVFEGDLLTGDLITGIYTTNSILSKGHEKIKVYEI